MKRAALIVTDAVDILFCDDGESLLTVVNPSPQLLADLRTLVAFPDALAAEFAPGLASVTLTTEVGTLLAAQEAADHVRALLPGEES